MNVALRPGLASPQHVLQVTQAASVYMAYSRFGSEQGTHIQIGQRKENRASDQAASANGRWGGKSRATDWAREGDVSGTWGGCRIYLVAQLPSSLAPTALGCSTAWIKVSAKLRLPEPFHSEHLCFLPLDLQQENCFRSELFKKES